MNDTLIRTAVTRLQTRRKALNETRVVTEDVETGEGEIVLKIERVAITTNNITYAGFGDAMQYWNFFPTGEADWGHMPVWGFADVLASDIDGIEVGERFYGYFPLASHIVMRPGRITPRGFFDLSEHRLELVSAYNFYTRCSNDVGYTRADESYQALLRPLFLTSFMCADFLEDNNFFGAKQVVVSSASSKTAFGTAFCLRNASTIKLIALTSERNRAFVDGLGCYQQTASYETLATLDASLPTLYLDFSGDEELRAKVHRHFLGTLVYDCLAGSAQNTAFLRKTELPGPEAKLYFAPVQIKKRNKDWGHDVVNQRYGAAEASFIRRMKQPDQPWMKVVEHKNYGAAQSLIGDLHAGRIDPSIGHVVVLGEGNE